jgi:poly(3-hydroxybutyrate) depolymerase
MKHTFIILTFVIFGFSFSINAQEFQTLNYLKNDSTSLCLDLFLPKVNIVKKVPLIIFVHGGGFSGGDRTAGHIFGKFLASKGYACASISYTLYMKNKDFGCNGVLAEKVKAIRIAASDLWAATTYLNSNAKKLNIDTAKIFIAGSSAGAETVLHAAYWDYKKMNLFKNSLSPTFKYAGVIAGAGAIMDLNLITPKNLLPTMLYHGDADPTVPYKTAAHHYCTCDKPGWLMLFGSYSIYNHTVGLNGNVKLTTFCGGDHRYNNYYMTVDIQTVVDFVENVIEGTKFQSHILISK